jgi:hypothetical protein
LRRRLRSAEFLLSEDGLAAEERRLSEGDRQTTFKVEGASGKWVSCIRPSTKWPADALRQQAASPAE